MGREATTKKKKSFLLNAPMSFFFVTDLRKELNTCIRGATEDRGVGQIKAAIRSTLTERRNDARTLSVTLAKLTLLATMGRGFG